MPLVNLLCGAWSWLVFAFLYLPIILLVVFSFNKSELVSVWEGFSFAWRGRCIFFFIKCISDLCPFAICSNRR